MFAAESIVCIALLLVVPVSCLQRDVSERLLLLSRKNVGTVTVIQTSWTSGHACVAQELQHFSAMRLSMNAEGKVPVAGLDCAAFSSPRLRTCASSLSSVLRTQLHGGRFRESGCLQPPENRGDAGAHVPRGLSASLAARL